MPFTLIKGTFHVLGKQPDGDSIRFKANNKANWKKLTTEAGKPVTADLTSPSDGTVQLRIEAIDALETHYKGNHQPMKPATDATLQLLKLIGFTSVQLGPSGKVVTGVAQDGLPGYILTRYIDNPLYKRPVAFAFAGSTPLGDGREDIYLDKQMLRRSVNYKMMQAGFVYPVFYNTLFYDLRNELISALKKARQNKKNIWHPTTGDSSNKGFRAIKLVDLEDKEIVFPKLFRRLADFHNAKSLGYAKTLKNFRNKFLPPKGDIVEIMSISHTTDALDFVIDIVSVNKLKLKYLPEDLKFFQPKPKN
ncbi:MAG: hypothetical protein ACT4OJ_13415 [Bacteroidota bacterium]